MPTPANGPAQPFTPPEGYVFKDDSAPAQSAFQANRAAMGPVAAAMANPARPIPQNRAQAMGMLQANLPSSNSSSFQESDSDRKWREQWQQRQLSEPSLAPSVNFEHGQGSASTIPGLPQLNGVPSFDRGAVDWNTISEDFKPDPNAYDTAKVDPRRPRVIEVNDPATYFPSTRGHEATHIAQFAGKVPAKDIPRTIDRGLGEIVKAALIPSEQERQDNEQIAENQRAAASHPDNRKNSIRTIYDYHDQKGLIDARKAGRTIADYTVEQQGAMVGDYIREARILEQKAANGDLTIADRKRYAMLQAAYDPFLAEMAMSGKSYLVPDDITHRILGQTGSIPTRPRAPSGPSPEVAGVDFLKPSPYLGGGAVPIR